MIEDWPRMRDAEPNAGHRALARLYEAGLLHFLITQNIDGQHAGAEMPVHRLLRVEA